MTDSLVRLRHACRSLRRKPAFTIAALATLALGIGLTTAVFTLVHATLLRPLPFNDPERLVTVWESRPADGVDRNVVNPGNFLRWREQATSFSSLAAYVPWSVNLAADGLAERASIAWVSGDFFAVLGGATRLGRPLAADDATPEAPAVVVLSHALWRSRFGGDPEIVGRELQIDGEPAIVVGVADPRFDLPTGTGIWAPYALGDRMRESRGRYLRVVGRLAPGAEIETAATEMRLIAQRVAEERHPYNTGWSAHVVALDEVLVGDYRRALWLLLGATLAVLLIACANLAGLLMAHNADRRHQLAVHAALGAGRGAIAGRLMLETILLAVAGGAAGLAVARLALGALRRALPLDLPAFVELTIDARVLVFAAGATAVAALAAGLAPAWHAARLDLASELAAGERRGGSRAARAARSALVVGQVAVSLALLATAGLLVRSLDRLRSTETGFDLEGLVAAPIYLGGPSYAEPASHVDYFARLERRLAGDPAIADVGSISWLPLGGAGTGHGFRAADQPPPQPGQSPGGDVRFVTPGFARTTGLELVAGRWIEARDVAGAPLAVVVNELAARELWSDRDPLGRRILMEWAGGEQEGEVVGVAAPARLERIDKRERATVYWSQAQLPSSFMTVLVRPRADVAAAAAAVRRAAAELDPQVPVASVQSMRDVVADSTARPRFTSELLALFAALALTLAAIGLYGLLAGAVAERRRELGVRMVLGADGRRLLVEVAADGARRVLLGIAIGVPAALAAGRLVGSQLYETSPHDPLVLTAAPLALVIVALAACLAPARRAARTDPATVLRES